MTCEPRRAIIGNVFAISSDLESMGSCFRYDTEEGLSYLITVAHVIKKMTHAVEGELYILNGNEWECIKATPYFASNRSYENGDIDIAVLKMSTSVKDSQNFLELSYEGCTLGQDVYFLGFPYFGKISYSSDPLNNGFPFPLLKKATLSNLPQKEEPYFYLDCHNNPGFSGGPVTFWDEKSKKQKVIGVISSYICHQGEFKQIQTHSSSLVYNENSGIALSYKIQYAKDIIDQLSFVAIKNMD